MPALQHTIAGNSSIGSMANAKRGSQADYDLGIGLLALGHVSATSLWACPILSVSI